MVTDLLHSNRGKEVKLLIFMDINMPQMGGVETTTHIRRIIGEERHLGM